MLQTLVAVSPVSGHFITQQAYLFTVLSWEHAALSTSWLLPCSSSFVFNACLFPSPQLITTFSHSFSLKKVYSRDIPELWSVPSSDYFLVTYFLHDIYYNPTTIFICLFPHLSSVSQLECEASGVQGLYFFWSFLDFQHRNNA